MAGNRRYVCLLAAATLAGFGGQAHAGKPKTSEETVGGPLSITSIKAVFIPTELATKYTVDFTDVSKGDDGYDAWVLGLTLVDPAGSSPPGNSASHAAVDESCDNSKLAGGSTTTGPEGGRFRSVTVWSRLGDSFTWYHGDKGSYSPSLYGCDHTKMGPSGHQGIVGFSVTSRDGNWTCFAEIQGTNLSTVPEFGDKPSCKSDLRDRLEELGNSVGKYIEQERAAAAEVGSKNAHATEEFKALGLTLFTASETAKLDGGDDETVADLDAASKLDADAAKQDLGTAAGRTKALADVAGATKLKMKARAHIEALAAAAPLH